MARLIVGDELGIVKGMEATSLTEWASCKVAHRWGEPNRRFGIHAMCLSSRGGITDTESALLAVSRADSTMQVLDPTSGQVFADIHQNSSRQTEKVAGLAILWEGTSLASRDVALLSCTQGGLVRMHSPKEAAFRSNLGASTVWDEVTSWNLGQLSCDCMAVHAAAERIAVGGHGSEIAVYDVAAQKQVFQAKGAKKDFLGLQDKPWVSAMAWLPGADNRKVIVGTGSSKIRLYDLSTDMRRPVMETSFKGQTKVTSVVGNPAGSVWAANGAGCVQLWDITANRMMDALKGTAGSVRSLSLHPEAPLIASVGLDRWLRVHHTGTKKQIAKIYLKQQLTGVEWCPIVPVAAQENAPATVESVGRKSGKPKSGSGQSKKRKQSSTM